MVIALVPVLAPSVVVKVIVAVPVATRDTSPAEFTVALVASDDVHVPVLSLASAGNTLAVSWTVEPTAPVLVAGVTLTLVTGTSISVSIT